MSKQVEQTEVLPSLNVTQDNVPLENSPAVGSMSYAEHIKLHAVGRAVSQETKNIQWEDRQDKMESREALYMRENLPAPTTRGINYYLRFADQTVTYKVHADFKTKRVFFSQIAVWDENPASYDDRKNKGRGRRFSIDANAKFIRYNAFDGRVTDSGDQWLDDSWQSASFYWQNIVHQIVTNTARAKLIINMDYERD